VPRARSVSLVATPRGDRVGGTLHGVTPFVRLPSFRVCGDRRPSVPSFVILDSAMATRKRKVRADHATPRDLPATQPDAAGIDVGAPEHFVAVPLNGASR
jgi:hypothetical protein